METLKRIDGNVVKIPLSAKYRYVFVQAPPLKKHMVIRALEPAYTSIPETPHRANTVYGRRSDDH